MNFLRTITPMGLLLAGIGSVIGSGWLFGPLYAAQIAGPAAALSWIIGGILMIVIALTFAELGTAFPVAGGMIQYAQVSHGSLVSFLIGWMVWISSVSVAPVETMGLLQYVANYIPGLMISKEGSHILTHIGMLTAAAIMFLMCILNYFGAQFFSRSNNLITTIKLIVPILTIIVLISMSFHSTNFHNESTGGFAPFGWHGVFAALPLGGVIYAFIGSNTVLQLAGETKNPQRSIPFALIGSMLFCILLYTLLQIAFIGALTPSSFAAGWSHLHFSGDTGPFSGLMMTLGLGWFVMIIYADAIISPFGTGFIFTASTARIGYGLSQIGFLPDALAKITKNGIPSRYILLNFCIGLLLFLPFPGWQQLVGFVISCFIVSYVIGPIALVGLRQSQPDIHRPFFLPFGKTIALIAFYICNLLIFWTGWQTVLKIMIALSIGVLFYVIYCIRHKSLVPKKDWLAVIWVAPYFILMTLISYLGTFGAGMAWIPFGIDFGVIAILSLGIFYLVLKTSRRSI